MSDKRIGTPLCGWCLGPPGARRPHFFGVQIVNCPCGCHRKPKPENKPIEKKGISTDPRIAEYMKGGGYGTGEAA